MKCCWNNIFLINLVEEIDIIDEILIYNNNKMLFFFDIKDKNSNIAKNDKVCN